MKKITKVKSRYFFSTLSLLSTITILLSACSTYFVATKPSDELVEISSKIEPSAEIEKLTAPYKAKFDTEMSRVIGQSNVRMTKPGNQAETLLGNFFTEIMLYQGKKFDPQVDIAFATKGGLRIELPKGPITISHIFELMPFENKLTILELTAESVQDLANFIASSGGQPVAGLRMKIQAEQAIDIEVNGQKLDTSKKYKVITYDYLANGGDNSRGLTNPISRIDLDLKVRECILQYIEKETNEGKNLTSTLDGRVKNNQ